MKPSEWIQKHVEDRTANKQMSFEEFVGSTLQALMDYLDEQYANHGNDPSPKEDSQR
jgi:hypothetical protein